MADMLDVVELLIDIPESNLRAGQRGTIVHCHEDGVAYEVEFVNDAGETVALMPLQTSQFNVVWRSKTKEWVPTFEQASAVIATLSEDGRREVLDFARFLALRGSRAEDLSQ
jgi:hypothetical protein